MFVVVSAKVWMFKLWGNLGKDLNIQTEISPGTSQRLDNSPSPLACWLRSGKISLGERMMSVVKEGFRRWTFPCG